MALLYQLYDLDLMQAIGLIGNTVTDLGIRISLIYMIIAAADFIYQKRKIQQGHENDQAGSKRRI